MSKIKIIYMVLSLVFYGVSIYFLWSFAKDWKLLVGLFFLIFATNLENAQERIKDGK
jgi:hypothetical protein